MAVIEGLKKAEKGAEILYIGATNGVEKAMVQKAGIEYRGVACGKLRRYFSLQNFTDFLKVPVGIWQAYRILREFKPAVIFSKGGFVSVPVVIAARMLRIRVILHESDLMPGLANRICARFATKICMSFEESKPYFEKWGERVIFTGSPVRKCIFEGDAERGYKFTGFDKHRPILLVMGGSQGAQQINELVRGALDELLKKFQIVHIRGRGNLDISLKRRGYQQYEYLDEPLKDIYAICEMIISRGGANSLFEIALLKKKALIIPLGNATRGEQVENARIFVGKLGWSMLSGEIKTADFLKSVEMAFESEVKGKLEFKNGTGEIVKLILA